MGRNRAELGSLAAMRLAHRLRTAYKSPARWALAALGRPEGREAPDLQNHERRRARLATSKASVGRPRPVQIKACQ
jgi:hypothetical protein